VSSGYDFVSKQSKDKLKKILKIICKVMIINPEKTSNTQARISQYRRQKNSKTKGSSGALPQAPAGIIIPAP
jgi:hypothetical protein